MDTNLTVFEEYNIRRIYDEENETWLFSVINIVQALTQQPDYLTARKYYNKLKGRLALEGNQSVTKFVTILILVFISIGCQAQIINTIFGPVDETNPALLELISSNAMQRLKYIDQSGPDAYFTDNFAKFSRYEHSLGVYALLKRYNVSIEEQISGLLHDASHTVFSHLGDLVFQNGRQRSQSYQDNIHELSLKHMGIDQILAKHKLTLPDVSPKNPQFLALEQPYPDMNADRIEYNLHTALVFNDLTSIEMEQILTCLKFENNKWYFTDITHAKKFARLSTYYNKAFWGSVHNQALHSVATAMLKYALQENIINSDELHFSVDEEILQKLQQHKSTVIQQLLAIMHNIDNHYIIANLDDAHLSLPIKMRGIDPWVLHAGSLQRLSDLSHDFKNELSLTKTYCKRGALIKFINISNNEILQLIIAENSR